MYSSKTIPSSLPKEFKVPHLLSNLPENSAILVGFSGGADSTALLHLLCRYSKLTGAKIYAAHLNHGIRGEEADRDERFCSALADKLGVEFFSRKADVPTIAKETGESVESAARNVRYEFFASVMREKNIQILATAHNADDNLETMIFNLSRGSGLNGLCGIPECRPCDGGVVIRPILGMEKKDIIAYCGENGLDFVTDSTNVDTDYTRNKIRSEIIPVLRQINSGAVKNAYRTARNLHEDALCLEALARSLTDDINRGYSIALEKFCSSHASITNRALMRIYTELSDGNTLEAVHVEAIRELVRRAVPHSSVSLPSDFEAVIEDQKLHIRKKRSAEGIAVTLPYTLKLGEGSNFISQTNCEIFIGTSHNAKNIYKKSILLPIDFDKIEGGLVARNRLGGDKIRINGMNKSLKKLLCEKKIPLDIRARLPIICDDKGIVAVPFIGVRDGAKRSDDKIDNKDRAQTYFYLL